MKIRLLTYLKKKNDTARPSFENPSAYTERDFVFKAPTSVNNPTIILSHNVNTKFTYNYAYIVELDMYYRVVDVVYNTANTVSATLKVDPLATARQYILSSTAFVVYSSSNYNEYLNDDRIVPTADVSQVVARTNLTDVINTNFNPSNDYSYVLTTFSKVDGLASYLINGVTLSYLTKKLAEDGASVWASIKEMFGDAAGSIIDLKIFPYNRDYLQNIDVVSDTSTRIYLGDYDTEQDGYLINDYFFEFSDVISFDMPDDFSRCSPYTDAKIFLPLIGTIDLSLDELSSGLVGFHYICNLASGEVSCQLTKGGSINSQNGAIIGNYNANCAVNVPIAFSQINGAGVLTSAGGAVVSLITKGVPTLAGIAAAVAGMGSSFKSTTSVINAFGGNFAGAAGGYVKIMLFKHGLSEVPDNLRILYGRPCNKVLALNTLTGYCQTAEFQLQAPFNEAIITEVNDLMNSGVYLN